MYKDYLVDFIIHENESIYKAGWQMWRNKTNLLVVNDDDKFVVEKIHIFEWISRLIRHIPDRNFKTIRYYGIYASREHKLYNTCRLLIDKLKLPFYKSLTKWRNLMITTFNIDPLKCPNCGSTMKLDYG